MFVSEILVDRPGARVHFAEDLRGERALLVDHVRRESTGASAKRLCRQTLVLTRGLVDMHIHI